jgi:hypothetical protein
MQIACVVESFVWSHFREALIKDMLWMAYVDARTTKFDFHELFLAVPFLRIEKFLRRFQWNGCSFAKRCLTRDTSVFGTQVGLLLLRFHAS